VHSLTQRFEQRGLEVLVEDKLKNPDYYLPIEAQTVLLGLAEYLYKDPSVEKYQEQLATEHSQGVFVDLKFTCVVARTAR
jgi:hypothetical protein